MSAAATACTAGHTLVPRDTAELGLVPSGITWFAPSLNAEGATLARWRRSVGPPVIVHASSPINTTVDEIAVVSWNTALGEADVVEMVRSSGLAERPLVLLLQEVYRGGPEVPRELDRGATFAGHLSGASARPDAREVESIASELGLSLYYVPSMRNGGPSASDEDRGNAVLTNLALGNLTAFELPFERQRRVAVAATIGGVTSAGAPWTVRVVSAHLDNVASARHWWIGGEYGRVRQARGLVALVRDEVPTILGGDFNTWFGASEQAYIETAAAFPDAPMRDTRPTFRGLLRLDHVFLRLSPGWRADFRRADDRFGSDHHPLVGTVRFR